MRLVVVSLVCLCLSTVACDQSPEQKAQDVCAAFCDCETQAPALNKACVSDCVADIGTVDIPDTCVDCIYQYSQVCGDLQTHCEAACQVQQPQP